LVFFEKLAYFFYLYELLVFGVEDPQEIGQYPTGTIFSYPEKVVSVLR